MTEPADQGEEFTIQMWREQYRPLNEDAIDMGRNYDLLKTIDYHYIWTECDFDGVRVVKNGWHKINEQGVFICTVTWEEDEDIIAVDEKKAEEEEEDEDLE